MDATLYSERLTVSPRGPGKSVTLDLARAFREQEHSTRARLARPTRVTHLSVTQIDGVRREFPAQETQLVNGYRNVTGQAAKRAKDNRQIAPPNLKGQEEQVGWRRREIFPIDNNKRKHQARAGEEEHRLPISSNLGVVPVVFTQSIHLGPAGPVFCSDIAMTFELSPECTDLRPHNPTERRGPAPRLRHFEYICYAHAMLGVVEEGLSFPNGNCHAQNRGYVGDDPRAFGHATLRGDGDAVLAFLRSQSPEQSQYICYLRSILEDVVKGLGGHK
ncbi:hypothetical protein B0H14DRAFT_2739707 [Mycena olivaceomarginata]|nr:hypothetical protein B0H14DRAFT_2739707 [Mycena olivaceomarginata]